MLLQIITICISVSNKIFTGINRAMKMAWGGLLIGMSALPAVAMNCESSSRQGELQGKFDASGEVCFDLPTLGENYVSATISGVTDARLLDENNRRCVRCWREGRRMASKRCCSPCR
ncbi:esterase [Raoultella ornithinolytica]|nr:esterase [Raoultella ornithinolytica]